MSNFHGYDQIRSKQILQTLQFSHFFVHEDDHFLLCNKPFDLQIDGVRPLTLTKLIKKYRPSISIRFCHQLDYATSGIITIAKTKLGAQKVNNIFANRTATKFYLAIVVGHLTQNQTVRLHISAHPNKHYLMCATPNDGKSAHTIITPLGHGVWNKRKVTKVLLQPITGRRHQLRVHCKAIGHSILGDMTYAQDSKPFRMMLHAQKLHLPLTSPFEPITAQTEDPFPASFFDTFTPVNSPP